ncbi:Alpha/beta-hydrolase [Mycena kentingensis (nom. inval.)]|nr:Alpha/beta-hydrolase [Mycena kentingensis (nom. inval.)]
MVLSLSAVTAPFRGTSLVYSLGERVDAAPARRRRSYTRLRVKSAPLIMPPCDQLLDSFVGKGNWDKNFMPTTELSRYSLNGTHSHAAKHAVAIHQKSLYVPGFARVLGQTQPMACSCRFSGGVAITLNAIPWPPALSILPTIP